MTFTAQLCIFYSLPVPAKIIKKELNASQKNDCVASREKPHLHLSGPPCINVAGRRFTVMTLLNRKEVAKALSFRWSDCLALELKPTDYILF